jgi:hypothetical protein
MIPVSDAYRTAIDADMRNIKPRVLVYFDGDSQPPVEFDEDTVVDIHLLEEARAESDNPLGLVSSNEITISFRNDDRAFTPTNPASPYYGKLRPNVLVKPYLGVETSPGVFEWVPLGVFRTGDWSAPSDSVEATITCYDKLYEIGNKDVPMLPAVAETTIYGLFGLLFQALGLSSSDYLIDPSLNQPVRIGWLPKGKVKDALQTLAVAGNCSVMVDRYGIIRVRSNFVSGSPVAVLTDNDQIISAENPQKYLDTYNVVKVNYKSPYLKPLDSLLKIDSLTVPNGGITLQNIEFSSSPVVVVDQVKIIGAKNSAITSMQYGAWAITIEIANPGPDETVSLEVTGRAAGMINSAYTAKDDASVALWGEKKLEIDNVLIQDLNATKTYADMLLNLLKDPYANFSLNIRGDPALEVGDTIKVQDAADKIGDVTLVPIRITLDYDGALEAKVKARKPILPYQWTFISPGLAVYGQYGLKEWIEEYVFVSPGLPAKIRR